MWCSTVGGRGPRGKRAEVSNRRGLAYVDRGTINTHYSVQLQCDLEDCRIRFWHSASVDPRIAPVSRCRQSLSMASSTSWPAQARPRAWLAKNVASSCLGCSRLPVRLLSLPGCPSSPFCIHDILAPPAYHLIFSAAVSQAKPSNVLPSACLTSAPPPLPLPYCCASKYVACCATSDLYTNLPAAPFPHIRRDHHVYDIAPYKTSFANTSLISSTTTQPFPLSTATSSTISLPSSSASPLTTLSANASSIVSRASCTVNVPNANLDWWYTKTPSYASTIFSIKLTEPTNAAPYATAYTIYTQPPLNITSLLKGETYSVTTTFNTRFNSSYISYVFYSTPTPVAPYTTIITQSAYKTGFPSTSHYSTATGLIPYSSYLVNLPPATTVIASRLNSSSVM